MRDLFSGRNSTDDFDNSSYNNNNWRGTAKGGKTEILTKGFVKKNYSILITVGVLIHPLNTHYNVPTDPLSPAHPLSPRPHPLVDLFLSPSSVSGR